MAGHSRINVVDTHMSFYVRKVSFRVRLGGLGLGGYWGQGMAGHHQTCLSSSHAKGQK